MKKFIILLILPLLLFFTACSTMDKTFFKTVDTPVLDAQGNQKTDAAGNLMYDRSYENTALLNAIQKTGESLPGIFGTAFGLLSTCVAGFLEWRKRTIVKTKDGEILELEQENSILSKGIDVLAVATDSLWNWADGIEGGQKIIEKFKEFANSAAGKDTQKLVDFVNDTLAKAQTPDQVVGQLVKLETLSKAES